MSIIKTIDLVKEYKDLTAVNKLNLEINEGEVFALLGVNGAGKTTTIKMLTGLTKPTSGTAIIMDKDILKDGESIKEYINVSPQETAIAPNLSVIENIQFIAGIYGIDKETTKKNVDYLMKELKLEKVMNKKAKTLSGGWQRRVSIAMALITNPKILFLDEPTLGLDVLARRELWSVVENLKGKITIILTTHYMEEAESLADRVGIMADGNLIDVDTPKDLVEKSGAKNFEDAFVKIVSGGVK